MTLIYQVIRTTMRFVASRENCHLCNPLVVNNSGVVSVIHSSRAAFHMQRNMHVSIFKKCSSWRISECFKHLSVLIKNFKYLFCLLCVHRNHVKAWKKFAVLKDSSASTRGHQTPCATTPWLHGAATSLTALLQNCCLRELLNRAFTV